LGKLDGNGLPSTLTEGELLMDHVQKSFDVCIGIVVRSLRAASLSMHFIIVFSILSRTLF
jgi:hypothetical protein